MIGRAAAFALALLLIGGEVSACGFGSPISGGQCQGFLTSGTSWTVPSDWSGVNKVEAIGGGGSGGADIAARSAQITLRPVWRRRRRLRKRDQYHGVHAGRRRATRSRSRWGAEVRRLAAVRLGSMATCGQDTYFNGVSTGGATVSARARRLERLGPGPLAEPGAPELTAAR